MCIQTSMALALVFNPGSNSLKFELIECEEQQAAAVEAKKIASASVDGIAKHPKLLVFNGRELAAEHEVEAGDMTAGVHAAIDWLCREPQTSEKMERLDFAGVRVVHGGSKYECAVRVSREVRADIEALRELAPLHNESSLHILDVLEEKLAGVPVYVAFDTAFHRTLPEKAWRYPIEREVADRHGIRKFGFHGLSHRYMLEHYAHTVGKQSDEISLVTLHLESGCSACAIAHGNSVDTTMGFTPLEGLMMGARSGSIDPAIFPYLMKHERQGAEEVLKLLNKRSGLLGIAGGSLDTRELEKREDEPARLALAMFGYRVRLAVGAYLAALGDAEAVLFGGGIGEDSPWLRTDVCTGLAGWGLEFDEAVNARSTAGMARISKDGSRLAAWTMAVEEGLEIAHECWLARKNETR